MGSRFGPRALSDDEVESLPDTTLTAPPSIASAQAFSDEATEPAPTSHARSLANWDLHPTMLMSAPSGFMSGRTERSILPRGVLDEGLWLLPRPVMPAVLLRKVREVSDDAVHLGVATR